MTYAVSSEIPMVVVTRVGRKRWAWCLRFMSCMPGRDEMSGQARSEQEARAAGRKAAYIF